ncbi:MAG: amino acid permease [Gemmatimonadota bacterium]|nr:amino acid permease [Gemmatimonadota bacterium]
MNDEKLVRAVGVGGLTSGIINYTIGAGIFVLPAVVAARIGGAAIVAYVVCAVAMTLIVLCFAQAGSRVSLSGGAYAYAGTVFGPYVGFVVAMMLWFGANVLASASVANIFVGTLGRFIPAAGEPTIRGAILVALYATLAIINIRGVQLGVRVVEGFAVAKLTPLIILVVVGVFAVQAANFTWPGMPSYGEISRTSAMLIFAFLGVESALTPSGEVRDPARTVPRAVFLALGVVTLLYLAIQTVAQGILGAELATNTAAPLAAAARVAIGRGGEILVIAGTAISTFGYVAGDMLAAPRGIYALARDGLLPSPIATVHPVRRTPTVAIAVHAIACCALAITGSFESLLVLATLATLLVYLACCVAAFELRRRNIQTGEGVPFRIPGGPAVPVLASAVVVWLISSATRAEFMALGWMMLVSTVLFFAMKASRRGVA